MTTPGRPSEHTSLRAHRSVLEPRVGPVCPAPAVTVTVTAAGSPATAPAKPNPGAPATFFSGELVWGRFNLDQAVPKTVGNNYIESLASDELYVSDVFSLTFR